MNTFKRFLQDYFKEIPPLHFLLTSLFISILIFINYTSGIEKRIRAIGPWPWALLLFFVLYLFVFSTPYLFRSISRRKQDLREKPLFFAMLFLAAAFFACKAIHWDTPAFIRNAFHYPWNDYFAVVLQLPAKLVLLLLILLILWKTAYRNEPFVGFTLKGFKPAPYLLVLLFLVPFIAFASTRADFLHTYPKVKSIAFIHGFTRTSWPWKLLYECSYGLDFISIEIFFRGLLVLGFIRFVGVDAILPMAAFYCSVHFGKPLAECISSYAGGLALGVIVYRTKSIFGGLIVHLGLAWLMEVGGYAGQLYFNSR